MANCNFPGRWRQNRRLLRSQEALAHVRQSQLEQSGKRLPDGTRSRKKTNNAWYEMQDACAYHAEFSREKLFWMDLTDRGRFAYEDGERFCLSTVFMMTGQALK